MAQPVSGYLYPSNLVLAKASNTISGSGDSTAVDLNGFDSNGITLIVPVSAVSGSGSIVLTPQESFDGSTNWTSCGESVTIDTTQVAINPPTTLFVPDFQGPYFRVDYVLTGTSVTFSVIVYGNPAAATASAGFTTSPVGQNL